jgi:uncharacterized protein (TIGR03437 family)
MNRLASVALLVFVPAAVFAESNTPSIGYSGAPTDHGGQNCRTCHSSFPLNDPSGSLQVTFSGAGGGYVPNVPQTIRIVIQNNAASMWGFQLTIREQSNETLSSGTFSISSTTAPEQVVCDNGSQYGSPGPCNDTIPRQFAEHHNAPSGAGGTAYEFDVLWTPPSQEIGRLEVYIAAVAANGDGKPTGDYVYTYTQALENTGTCDIPGVPAFHNIVSSASFQPGFSSGAMATITGTGFQTSGDQRTAGLGDYVNGAYPTELGCVSVEVTGPGLPQPVPIPIAFVNFGQINVQMPEFSGVGPVTLTVTLNPGVEGKNSALATLNSLQPFAPAFFMFSNSTSIAAEEAHTGSIVADPNVVAGASPAKPGDIVALYGTGFGTTNPAVLPGQLATGMSELPPNSITVMLGDTTLPASNIQYAGLSPGSISGLYQINILIPSTAPTGEVPVTVKIGGLQTQAGVTIPIE